ncbi:pre-mRNA-processing protein prp40-like [Culex quinquefasciatus]|uniref:pre-mRNA-processing protein prp40-like n=1 Tax=Culex quinquefasciatus TaxID=7176 RepID=UPI0018E2EF45|nr:pre-mRNA-processing protein prp40-like [Culex quinquefasciatus]
MAAAATAESEWTEHRTEDGRPFYWNAAMKKSVWEKPDGFQPKTQAATGMEVEVSEGGGEDGGEFRPVIKVQY